jgi:hypothetical protein
MRTCRQARRAAAPQRPMVTRLISKRCAWPAARLFVARAQRTQCPQFIECRAVRECGIFDAIAAGSIWRSGAMALAAPISQPICRPSPAAWRQIAIYAAPGGAKSEQVVVRQTDFLIHISVFHFPSLRLSLIIAGARGGRAMAYDKRKMENGK